MQWCRKMSRTPSPLSRLTTSGMYQKRLFAGFSKDHGTDLA